MSRCRIRSPYGETKEFKRPAGARVITHWCSTGDILHPLLKTMAPEELKSFNAKVSILYPDLKKQLSIS